MLTVDFVNSLIGLGGAAIVMLLVNIFIKPATDNERWYPLGALAIGIVWNILLQQVLVSMGVAAPTLPAAVVLGILSGLGGSGLWSHTTIDWKGSNGSQSTMTVMKSISKVEPGAPPGQLS